MHTILPRVSREKQSEFVCTMVKTMMQVIAYHMNDEELDALTQKIIADLSSTKTGNGSDTTQNIFSSGAT